MINMWADVTFKRSDWAIVRGNAERAVKQGLVSACNGLAEILRPGGKYKAETPPHEAESEYFTSSLSLIWK
ncbi:hypothetical protein HOLleu_40430 [Holothuria leucospilota]|uniref:Uncharacterized protein n=1 Tax=Holothuria leucospilota TaxID=206669 RepID=A0A9Q0YDG9_HOLLE|nr:hypothetical protein HOLleu_40430 [Holothuria leucospilota]